ncbi:hypothetical protein BJY01DRAFT_245739 [Aspergillus pseudoustus]|uniref:Uncharacterized protein n=1 Tax=Aspergillus pseudoustus TaxID=1810923 RepID=A0ABR4KFD2_9EURO
MKTNEPDSTTGDESPSRGFLGNLVPSDLPHYAYTNRSQFEHDFQEAFDEFGETNEYFLVTGVTPEIFDLVFLPTEEEGSFFARWTSFDPELQRLLVRMGTSSAHENAAEEFSDALTTALARIGMRREIQRIGTAMHEAPTGRKQADKAFRPTRLPRGRFRDWPTVVVEVAYSESISKLQSDVRYWTRAGAGEVKVIITICVARNRPEIIIEKWGVDYQGNKSREQTVQIRKVGSRSRVSGGHLVLEFERLFLRAPTTPREQRNVQITEEDLEGLAAHVWYEQEFMDDDEMTPYL